MILSCHLNTWLRLGVALDDVVYLINLFGIKGQECFLLRTSNIFAVGLEVWAYDFVGFLASFSFLALLKDLLFRKYLEMTLTSLFDFAGRGGSRGTFSIVIRTGLDASLLFLLVGGGILGVNLNEIFALSVLDLLSV